MSGFSGQKLGGFGLRFGTIIAGLAALGIAGTALAESAKPVSLALPAPEKPTISVPKVAPIALFAADVTTLNLSKEVRIDFYGARASVAAPLDFQSNFDVIDRAAAPVPLLPLAEPRAAAAVLEWNPTNWGGLSLTAGNSADGFGLLGDYTPSPLAFSDSARASIAGLSAHVKFGNGWVTSFSYGADINQLDLKAGSSAALGTSSAHGQSYSLSIAKHGLFSASDSLGLSVSRPSQDYFGNVSLADAGLEGSVNLMNGYRAVTLGNEAKETDIALGYVTSFFHGALSLQANAGYQMNANGQNGANSVTVLSRAKINF